MIGNETYPSEIGRLANPHNDVALLEQALRGLDFDVTIARDVGLGALTRAVNSYARRVQAAGPGTVGFFYYSGHGASDGSTNYLIPVDVKATETGELWDQSLQLTEITRKLKRDASNATHFVVFDACRNTLKLMQPGSRAIVQSKGFVPVAQENGMLIAYATAEGELASDVGSGAGPYAKVLAEEIVKSGVEAVAMFRIVQRRVRAAIRQEPYLGFSALGDVYFAGSDVKPPAVTQARLSEVAEAWDRTKDTTSIVTLVLFISRYKDTYYAGLVLLRIEELKKQQVAVSASPKSPSSAPAPSIDGPRQDDPPLGVGAPERLMLNNSDPTRFRSRDYCGRTAKCKAFTFRHEGGACFWYESGTLQSNSYYTSGVATSGPVAFSDSNLGTGRGKRDLGQFQIHERTEVTGRNAGSTTVQTLEQCRDYCGRTAKCKAFTFRHEGGACFWYESGTLQSNSYYTSGVR